MATSFKEIEEELKEFYLNEAKRYKLVIRNRQLSQRKDMLHKKYSFRDIEEDLKKQYLKEAKSYNLRIINPTTTKTADENQDLEISRKKWTKQADLGKELGQLYGRWDNEKFKNLTEWLQINRELNRLFNEKDFMKNKNKVNELFKRRIVSEEEYENLKDSSQNNAFQ